MRLTTKGRYAVTAMLDLALHSSQGPVNLAEISLRQEISLPYLEQLFSKLRRQGLVDSVRGPGGGYRLSRECANIHVAAVIDAVDDRAFGEGVKSVEELESEEWCRAILKHEVNHL